MDIKLPLLGLPSPAQTLSGLSAINLLDLKVGQTLDAKVISTLVTTAQTSIALKLGNQVITAQSSQPFKLQPGQNLALQVTRIVPTIELKIVSTLPEIINQPLLLNLTQQTAAQKLQVQASVIQVNDKQIQLQISPDNTINTPQKPLTVTLERAAIPQTTEIVVGQQVVLEVKQTQTDKKPEFRLLASSADKIETKIDTLISQLLPKQESSKVLVTQLQAALPQLIGKHDVPPALLRALTEVLQNLPQKEQVINGEHLATVIKNSGIFLEAKLPLLVTNSVLAGNLKEAVISLLQKTPQLNSQKDVPEIIPKMLIEPDLKVILGKLLVALKQEIISKEQLGPGSAELEMLKNLHQKTENSVAKIVLEQLASLPREDSLKQVWHCGIAFMDNEKTQSAELEIQVDKGLDSPDPKNDWSVTINLNPPGLGILQCVVACRNKVISTYFKTQQKEAARLITDHLEHLKTQFEEQGLVVGHMAANEGGLQKSTHPGHSKDKKLFDDHA
ncbi:MAG: flagellar hook-length control protein FliK [Methylococcales bacterium]